MPDRLVTVLLCGDVMTGRGVDQILPHPGDPRLWEQHVRDAREYVALAERVNGPIPRPVDFAWPWGDALTSLDELRPAVRVINLETSITGSDDVDLGKRVHYRMNPTNMPCLSVATPDVCVLANNHVLDFGRQGLADTLDALDSAGIATAGAGPDATTAAAPAIVPVDGARVIVVAFGSRSSGIPAHWAATGGQSGVRLLPDLRDRTTEEIRVSVSAVRRPGDIVVASIHWGPNWGYDVPADEVRFAHRLIKGGVDIVHGHSSHHPRPIEVHHGKLILYGCGDLIDDYEGIGRHEEYRDELRLLYLASVWADTGALAALRMVPLRSRLLRLHHASDEERTHLRLVLDRISRPFGSRIDTTPDGLLELRAQGAAHRVSPSRERS